MATVKFAATKLSGTGKRGVLVPDADGYYTMAVGGLNVFNSAKEYYTLKGAEQLFTDSSIFMRRVRSGCLKSEVGHPKKAAGMTYDGYVQRIFSIEETNVCAHFKEIWLDTSFGSNNPQLNNKDFVAIMAKIKPTGPKGASLEAAFKNPHENVCFSIRAVTKDYYERGQCFRVLDNIVTFDWVGEPGIAVANKWDSPALECVSDQVLTRRAVEAAVQNTAGALAMEHTREFALDVLKSFAPPQATKRAPGYASW